MYEPVARQKMILVRVLPHCSPDIDGPQYEHYCQQKLMLQRPFWEYQQLKTRHNTLRPLLATFSQAASIHHWRMICISNSNSSNSNKKMQVSLIVIGRNLVVSMQGQHNQAREEWICFVPIFSS